MKRYKKFVFLFVFFLCTFCPPATYAQELILSFSPTPTPAQIDYDLPYPGILPDNPLYPIKVWRDLFTGFIISPPLKKAAYDLHQADKYIQASYLLVTEKKENKLAQQSFSQGQDYLDDALKRLTEAKQEGMDIRDAVNRPRVASLKYQEVLRLIEKKAGKDGKQFVKNYKRGEQLVKKAKALKAY